MKYHLSSLVVTYHRLNRLAVENSLLYFSIVHVIYYLNGSNKSFNFRLLKEQNAHVWRIYGIFV